MPIYLNTPNPGPRAGLLSRLLSAVVALAFLALFFVIAFPVFLLLLVIAIIGGVIFSWRFRKVRRQMEAMMREAAETSEPFSATDRVATPGSGTSSSAGTRPDRSRGETLEGEYEVVDREG